jgi:NTE family protein
VQNLSPELGRVAEALPWVLTLPESSRDALARQLEPVMLTGGATLFREGDAPDAMYVVLSGCLAAFQNEPDGPRLLGQVLAGETVGETAIITGQPRSATVRALRDCELVRISRASFEQLAERDPATLTILARMALQRVNAGQSRARRYSGPRTLALLPLHRGASARACADSLARGLARFGDSAVIERSEGDGRGPAWFSELERRAHFVIYVGDEVLSDWRRLCVRQADALVYVAAAGADPAPGLQMAEAEGRPVHLAVLQNGAHPPGAIRRWIDLLPQARVHQLRGDADAARMARLIIGRATLLVLSGGGARGFAHLGVYRALREAGIEVDAVGGTSIGAVIGAGIAAGWAVDDMLEVYRRAFVASNPLADFTIPFVSLVSGHKVSRLLREAFGELHIEDLPLPFFCVSSNLTSGQVCAHRSGPLWQWLRASLAIPGVLPPVFHGGNVYVDGGVTENLPVGLMRSWQRGEVIASDIGGDRAVKAPLDEFELPPLWRMAVQWYTGIRRPGLLSVLLGAGMVNAGAASLAARSAATLLLAPPLHEIELLEWRAFDRAIEIGHRHTQRVLQEGGAQLRAQLQQGVATPD